MCVHKKYITILGSAYSTSSSIGSRFRLSSLRSLIDRPSYSSPKFRATAKSSLQDSTGGLSSPLSERVTSANKPSISSIATSARASSRNSINAAMVTGIGGIAGPRGGMNAMAMRSYLQMRRRPGPPSSSMNSPPNKDGHRPSSQLSNTNLHSSSSVPINGGGRVQGMLVRSYGSGSTVNTSENANNASYPTPSSSSSYFSATHMPDSSTLVSKAAVTGTSKNAGAAHNSLPLAPKATLEPISHATLINSIISNPLPYHREFGVLLKGMYPKWDHNWWAKYSSPEYSMAVTKLNPDGGRNPGKLPSAYSSSDEQDASKPRLPKSLFFIISPFFTCYSRYSPTSPFETTLRNVVPDVISDPFQFHGRQLELLVAQHTSELVKQSEQDEEVTKWQKVVISNAKRHLSQSIAAASTMPFLTNVYRRSRGLQVRTCTT